MIENTKRETGFNLDRMSDKVRAKLASIYRNHNTMKNYLQVNQIHQGDSKVLLQQIKPNSIALSVWSPPYYVGKKYESHLTYNEWKTLLKIVIRNHFPIIKPGGFLVINISDILCYKDPEMPKVQAEAVSRKRSPVTRKDVLKAVEEHPDLNRYQLAELLNCSEQTVDRRLNGNNIRGGKYGNQTRVKIVGGLIEEWAMKACFYLYDRRVWVKDAAWVNSRWASLSYRSVDESEYLYFLWKPGVTKYDRNRLTREEWKEWGSRGVWAFPSVRANDDHEAKFPEELPRRVIKLLTDPGDVVLDCFMGSGTTALVATRENRKYLGIEIEHKYVKLARRKLAQLKMGLC